MTDQLLLTLCTVFFWIYAALLAIVPIAIVLAVVFEFKLRPELLKGALKNVAFLTIFWALCRVLTVN